MQRPGRKCFFTFCAVAIVYILLCGVSLHTDGLSTPSEAWENAKWVASSKNWIDRQMCRWLGLCGVMHLNSNGWTWERAKDGIPEPAADFRGFWTTGEEDPDSWSDEEKQLREIPQYVLDHAPYVHLFSGEKFWPSDVAEHLVHISPTMNYTRMDLDNDRNLTNLHDLDGIPGARHGRFVYLESDDNVEERPEWLTSKYNIPHSPDPRLDIQAEHPWPDADEPETPAPISSEQYAVGASDLSSSIGIPFPTLLVDLTPSTNGRCGGNSGFTCKGSKFGQCCSIHGWCGRGDEYCEAYCDPQHGKCNDPLYPPKQPHMDLRKRKRHVPAPEDQPTPLGKSKAPAILIVVDKGNGTVDAFWFYFYSFNLGQKVFNIRFGNHVGDWEHTMIRFQHGKPHAVFLSEHDFGAAYAWHALEKYVPNPDGSETMLGTWTNRTFAQVAKRPVTYSATGSHAMYATPGLHPYVLPWGLLHDQTDRGPLWDPRENLKAFTYQPRNNQTMRASLLNPRAPTSWLHYAGHWGDKYYPLSDPRQYRFAGQYHYVNGPTGPKFKRLGRRDVCQKTGTCRIRHWLGGDRATRIVPSEGEGGEGGEEGGLPGGNSTDDSG
ncbi:hypothetical protein B0A50_02594 [Salinomyces thailandicus]|uniref:Chitin-binding type-1 domain-containing protein n=1 Tax=Salinomyces thailandicus TaxID=706561 RepID=A0A4U0U604_9PEZI|nr:hypothetical protein B0A50_02594 [Salinomyces thailandica]